MSSPRSIQLRGASENNLRGIDVDIPLHCLTVVCGISGSGKTSLALDTLFAEGQRRYIESFSAYTRQFLARIEKPKFHSLVNLPPSLAVARVERARNNRSTVGTASELMEPMRILFSLVAKLTCSQCGEEVVAHSPTSVLRFLSTQTPGRAMLGFEFSWTSKTDLSQQLYDFQSTGLIRVLIDGEVVELSEDRSLLSKKVKPKGSGVVIVERFRIGDESRLAGLLQSLEFAFEQAGSDIVVLIENGPEWRFSKELRCAKCDRNYVPSEPRLFNFNSPLGACKACSGFGEIASLDMDKIVPDPSLSLREGAIAPWRTPSYAHELEELLALATEYQLPVDTPVRNLKAKDWARVQQGVPEKDFGGLDGFFAWLEKKKYKMHIRAFLARWRSYRVCPECEGARLSPEALSYRYQGDRFWDWCEQSVETLSSRIQSLRETESQRTWDDVQALDRAIEAVASRLQFLDSVGLGYLTLARTLHTLSGGEAQRVQLTTLLGSDLVDMLYVLDEPTVGLHPSDTQRVAGAIQRLVDRGNTVVLIEHEPYLLFRAEHVLEIGPGSGERGGSLCFSGPPSAWRASNTLTARYLFAEDVQEREPRAIGERWLRMTKACGRNLKVEEFQIPIGGLTTLIGVSGSGKSSLVLDTLVPAIRKALGEECDTGLAFGTLIGAERFQGCVAIDQSPIAKSIRSTPGTYTKAMDEIRSVFGALPESRSRGLTDSHFSFNSSAGRCPVCEGLGFTVVDMQFMADIRLVCTQCNGTRYQQEVLNVRYRDRNIADVLQMSIQAAFDFFRGQRKLQQRLQPLIDIGLGYLPLGQCVSSLSAGESMRLKLASHLEEKKNNLIVMDEPTTGLHFADVERLLGCIDVLIERGNTLLVIEHNEQMIRASDYLVELGPGPGPSGGLVIGCGPRKEFLTVSDTATTRCLHAKNAAITTN